LPEPLSALAGYEGILPALKIISNTCVESASVVFMESACGVERFQGFEATDLRTAFFGSNKFFE
jgi:hypothetical protein